MIKIIHDNWIYIAIWSDVYCFIASDRKGIKSIVLQQTKDTAW